jgi:hypothetical protein
MIARSSIAITRMSKTAISCASREPGVAQSIGTVLSLSLPLGDMDDPSRVGDVASGTSVSSSDSGDGSWSISSYCQGDIWRCAGQPGIVQDSIPQWGGILHRGNIFCRQFITDHRRGVNRSSNIAHRCRSVSEIGVTKIVYSWSLIAP